MTFISRSTDYKNKIIVFTTSRRGSYRIKEVDAITGESKLENSLSYATQIIIRLDRLIEK